MGWLQAGVANVNLARCSVRRESGREVVEVGSCDSPAIRSANGRVLSKTETNLHAGKNIQIRRLPGYWRNAVGGAVAVGVRRVRRAYVSVRIKDDLVAQQTLIRTFKSHSGLETDPAELQRIHQVTRRDSLDQVVTIGEGVLLRTGHISIECRLIAVEEAPDLPEVCKRPERVAPVVIVCVVKISQE